MEEEEAAGLWIFPGSPQGQGQAESDQEADKVNREDISGALTNSTLWHLPVQAKTVGKRMSMHRWYWQVLNARIETEAPAFRVN